MPSFKTLGEPTPTDFTDTSMGMLTVYIRSKSSWKIWCFLIWSDFFIVKLSKSEILQFHKNPKTLFSTHSCEISTSFVTNFVCFCIDMRSKNLIFNMSTAKTLLHTKLNQNKSIFHRFAAVAISPIHSCFPKSTKNYKKLVI